MKYIILTFICILTFGMSYAQAPDTCFTKTQIRNIYNNIRVLEHKDSTQSKLLKEYEFQVSDYKIVRMSDSTTISGQSIQIKNLEQNNKDLTTINSLVTPKWYEKPLPVSITTFISTIILISILR